LLSTFATSCKYFFFNSKGFFVAWLAIIMV
jgi:hypothetical protein